MSPFHLEQNELSPFTRLHLSLPHYSYNEPQTNHTVFRTMRNNHWMTIQKINNPSHIILLQTLLVLDL